MHRRNTVLGIVVATFAIFAGSSIFVYGAGARVQPLNLPEGVNATIFEDEDVPDVTARVARISFISGDAQIRRTGSENWETANLNLPVVEGDELTTGSNSRIEIQFDNYQHLRLAGNSFLKIVNLKDEGIAVSLSLGTLSLRITQFDKGKAYFEVDVPKTTVAIQIAGQYRIDAGQAGDPEIRVSVTEKGEARVYSDTAGFTLKNGRSARVFIDGPNVGEWESADSARYSDEFDRWSLDRDAAIALRIGNSHYNQYYDNDIYGADDLNGNGTWIHTASYGYVWRPYRNSINSYADWSPYRYGTWRWIPPFGWTWVNDEPWGWATYHHGRWFYDAGYWNWSPYGHYRYGRSWWFPALVVINVFNNNVCWYPLPYHHRYRNYNAHYNSHHGGHHNNPPPTIYPTGGIKPIPTPLGPPIRVPKITNDTTIDDVPPSGVVAVTKDKFGTGVKGPKVPALSIARIALSAKTDEDSVPILPDYSAIDNNIIARSPRTEAAAERVKVGASERKTDAPLDNELRTKRILGGRPPITDTTIIGGGRTVDIGTPNTRKTGAVVRPPSPITKTENPPVRQPPVSAPPTRVPVETTDDQVRVPREAPPVRKVTPRYDPPPVRQSPPTDPPTRQPPRNDPPTRQPPQTDPPVRQPPRSEPAPVKQPPPSKSEPKQEARPPVNSSKKSTDAS